MAPEQSFPSRASVVAFCFDAVEAPLRKQRRRARQGDASGEGLVFGRCRGLQRISGCLQAQGSRAGRCVGQRRPPVPAGRRVAWRGRPPDAPPRHGEVLGAGDGRRPGHVGGRGYAMDRRLGRGRTHGGSHVHVQWSCAGGQRRRVQARGHRGPVDARASLAIAQSGLAAGATGGGRDGLCRVERGVSLGSGDPHGCAATTAVSTAWPCRGRWTAHRASIRPRAMC